jgi:hypothetical protein
LWPIKAIYDPGERCGFLDFTTSLPQYSLLERLFRPTKRHPFEPFANDLQTIESSKYPQLFAVRKQDSPSPLVAPISQILGKISQNKNFLAHKAASRSGIQTRTNNGRQNQTYIASNTTSR